ncbi:hypothetical protein [Bifidobacterium miconisargentati]|uniref:hypothetical protein n=1 Tax=Bifidobacterium miconisargentati TaxID=2834437 RepID=UPI001BDC4BD1|nr:hypothetical protein [Bifidobacterium miconisargentati]MBW3090177.1 hypothetical protein [Bifidobacterium miconisargentati]
MNRHAGHGTAIAAVIRNTCAAALAVACLIGLAACSSPATTADDGVRDKPAGGVTAETTTGTSDDADDSAAGPAADLSTAELETIAKRFTACLVGKGFDAKVTASYALLPVGSTAEAAPQTTVVVRRLGVDGTPIIPGPGMEISGDSDPLYPDVMYSIVSADEGMWVGFKNSKALAGSIYADKQADYAACERENPDFAQPNYSANVTAAGGASAAGSDAEAQKTLIDFARQARKDGFDWMADPAPGEDKSVEIPSDVSYEELRRFYDTYSGDKWPSHDGIPFGTFCTGECTAYNRLIEER